jgi:hypothetical protein
MKAVAKYAICLLPTLVIGVFVGLFTLVIFSGGGCGHDHGYNPSPLPLSWTLLLPYWGISSMGSESVFTGIGLMSALQYPVYGGFLGWAWNKRRLLAGVQLLILIHFGAYFLARTLYANSGF